jgi:type VI secretion system secreted protein VgrG
MAEEHAKLSVAGQDLEVVKLDGVEAVSRLFTLEVVGRAVGAGLAPDSVAGQGATLTLFDSFAHSRSIAGVVSEVENLQHDDGSVTVRLVIRPNAYLLTLGSNCRAFVDKSVIEIVDQVLGGLPHRWEVGGAYAKREYTQQYREDDWTFVARQLESEGIHYWFDHAAGSQLVLSDDSTAAPELPGGAYLEVSLERGMTVDRERIEQLGEAASFAPGKFTVRSFNAEKPELKIEGSAGSGAFEIYTAPGGGPGSPEQASRQATIMSQAAGAGAAGVSGQASSVRIAPGMILEAGNHPLGRLDGRYFVTEASYRVRQRRRVQGDEERPYVCLFSAIRADVTFRPASVAGLGRQSGLQSGLVVGPPGQEIHPSELGQVRVQLHWDREGGKDERSGKWMRVAQRGTQDSFLIPRIGWNVLTFNEEGSADAPHVLSRVHDAEHPPAYKLPDNMTRVVFKTATSPSNGTFNEIYFEDKKGQELMFINASRDMTYYVQGAKNEGVKHDVVHTVGVDHDLTVEQNGVEQVDHDQTIHIGANETTDVSGNFDTTVQGNASTSIGGKFTLHAKGDAAISCRSTRSMNVGAAVIDTSLGVIAAEAPFVTVLTGGAHLKLSAASISESSGGITLQTIGGAKLEFAKLNRSLNVKKQFLETVGGVIVEQTEGNYTDGARKVASWTVGAKLSGQAPDIVIQGGESVTLKCGASSIKLTKDAIELCATEFDLSKAEHIETITKKIEHN